MVYKLFFFSFVTARPWAEAVHGLQAGFFFFFFFFFFFLVFGSRATFSHSVI